VEPGAAATDGVLPLDGPSRADRNRNAPVKCGGFRSCGEQGMHLSTPLHAACGTAKAFRMVSTIRVRY